VKVTKNRLSTSIILDMTLRIDGECFLMVVMDSKINADLILGAEVGYVKDAKQTHFWNGICS